MWRVWFKQRGTMAAGLGLACLLVAACGETPEPPEEKESDKPQTQPTRLLRNGSLAAPIEKETTFFTEPLATDGSVDYLAALNEKYGQSATDDTNMARRLFVIGALPDAWDEMVRVKAAKAMDVPLSMDTTQQYFSLYDLARRRALAEGDDNPHARAEALAAKLWPLVEGGWNDEPDPRVTEWLELNRAVIERVAELSRREHFFIPLKPVNLPPNLRSVRPVPPNFFRLPLTGLRAEAVHAAASDDPLQAVRLAEAQGRIARLLSRRPEPAYFLACMEEERRVHETFLGIIRTGKLDPAAMTNLAAAYDQLPEAMSFEEYVNVIARCWALDGAMAYQRRPYAKELIASVGLDPDDLEFGRRLGVVVDYGQAMARINTVYDGLATAAAQPTYNARLEAVTAALRPVGDEYLAARRRLNDAEFWFEFTAPETSDKRKREMMTPLLAPVVLLNPRDVEDGRPSTRRLDEECLQATTAQAYRGLTSLAIGIERYRHADGKLPESLSSLLPPEATEGAPSSPGIDGLPPDPFTGESFIYTAAEDGYLLYSVGPNGKDDGGEGDDVAVKM